MNFFLCAGGQYAILRANDHFSFYTLDFEMIEELKKILSGAKFGKGCAKVNYNDKAVPNTF